MGGNGAARGAKGSGGGGGGGGGAKVNISNITSGERVITSLEAKTLSTRERSNLADRLSDKVEGAQSKLDAIRDPDSHRYISNQNERVAESRKLESQMNAWSMSQTILLNVK